MNVISIKDYAKRNNVSYEAVRQQVVRYASELEGHIIKDGRQQLLDDDAVAFLDSKREKNPVVIMQQDKDDLIENLEAENKALLQRVALLQDDLIKAKDLQLQMQIELTEQKLLAAKTVEAETALTDARERAQTAEDIAEANAQEAERAKREADELRQQLEKLKKRNLLKRILNRE